MVSVTRRRSGKRVLAERLPVALVIAAILYASGLHSLTAQMPPVPAFQVKAAFLYQFSEFVTWPPESFNGPEMPLVIGILGTDPFGNYLDEILRNEKVADHPLTVRRFQRVDEVKTCHILFVSQSEASRMNQILAGLKGRNILTVSDADGFAEQGGMIQFVTQQNRVRLNVNLAAARFAHLTISSKLLRASTVTDTEER